MPDDDDEQVTKLSPQDRAKLFDLPEKPPPPAARPLVPDAPLELDRPPATGPVVIERIRVGGIATVVRVFVFSAIVAFVLFEALHLVFRH